MSSLLLFQITAVILGGLFLCYGMDVRRKAGACDFVAPAWQVLMKFSAFALLGCCGWVVIAMHTPDLVDWLGLAFVASGTAFIVAAKRALGRAHTFTGQYMKQTQLVTHGVYAITRNPLYFGVFQCEFGAVVWAAHQVPVLLPQAYPYWLCVLAAALVYAIAFNWTMARREARELERCFGDAYRRYRAAVPFLVPFLKLPQEIL